MESRLRAQLIGEPPSMSRARRDIRRFVAVLLGLAALAFSASGAAANDVTAKISCTEVFFNFTNFPDASNNVINETIFVDGVQVAANTYTFSGPYASNTVLITVPPGSHSVTAHADWNTNGSSGTFDTKQDVSCGSENGPCTVDGAINAGFNGTAVVGVSSGPAFIWFNSNLSVHGMGDGKSIFLTDSRVLINGVPHDVPDAKITFSGAVACATTAFDAGTNTWNTTVPLAGSDEIFISGLAFPVTNLPGGANVRWEGTFGTDQRGVCLSWKWGAAAYRSFTLVSSNPLVIDYNAAQIKPTHQAACLINNGDHAGTPQNPTIRASVTGGARGGGGSNFTGSWSGTGTLCPVCPPTAGAGTASRLTPVEPAEGSARVEDLWFATPSPNPTVGPNSLRFALPHEAAISLRAYDVTGRLVRELATGTFSAGPHTLNWDLLDRAGRPVSGGIYFLRLAVEGRVLQQNLSVTR